MRTTRRTALFSLAALGCRREHSLLTFAAASTAEAFSAAAAAYRKEKVRFSFAASGVLARQIEAGAQPDLFLSADAESVNRLENAGLVRARRDLLRNEIVGVIGTDSKIVSMSASTRIAIGDPATVPAGRYAKEWLEREHPDATNLVTTVDVRAALAAVMNGAAAIAIVYRSDVRVHSEKVVIKFQPAVQPRIVYPLAVMTSNGDGLAKYLVEEGVKYFEERGFLRA